MGKVVNYVWISFHYLIAAIENCYVVSLGCREDKETAAMFHVRYCILNEQTCNLMSHQLRSIADGGRKLKTEHPVEQHMKMQFIAQIT